MSLVPDVTVSGWACNVCNILCKVDALIFLDASKDRSVPCRAVASVASATLAHFLRFSRLGMVHASNATMRQKRIMENGIAKRLNSKWLILEPLAVNVCERLTMNACGRLTANVCERLTTNVCERLPV